MRSSFCATQAWRRKYLFDQPYFVDWYFSSDNNYVKIKQYVNHLDHMRLMLIEYITRYQSPATSTALLEQTGPNEHLRAEKVKRAGMPVAQHASF